MFQKLALAESRIHGVSVEDVHFHEVGAIDSILDIVGVAICVEYLQLDSILFSAIPVGRGSVETRHGKTILPAPATMELMSGYQVESAPADMEWVTPTGIALLTCFGEQSMVIPTGRIEKSVYAAGAANPSNRANILRGTLFTEGNVSSASSKFRPILMTCPLKKLAFCLSSFGLFNHSTYGFSQFL